MKHIKLFEDFFKSNVSEAYGDYEYKKFVKNYGAIKFPNEVKQILKDLVKGGFIDKVYDQESTLMMIWLITMGEDKFNPQKRKQELGETGAKLADMYWNDLTSYTAFDINGAMQAMEVSKIVQDKKANGEPVEPAYYEMKEYYNARGLNTQRNRVFDAAYKKLTAWMKENKIETL